MSKTSVSRKITSRNSVQAERSTFFDGQIDGVVITPLKPYTDSRGWLCELFRTDELGEENHPRMAYVSGTMPGVVRGPHEHLEQCDYFAFVGPGDFRVFLWDNREHSSTYGARQSLIVGETNWQRLIIPPGIVHAYENISGKPGWVFNAPNRLYAGPGRSWPVDEIRHEDDGRNKFVLDLELLRTEHLV